MGGCCSSDNIYKLIFGEEESWLLSLDEPESCHNDLLREEEPWCLSPDRLPSWYHDNIQSGTRVFGKYCRAAINQVVSWLHHKCANDIDLFDLSKIIKGGSFGKGTMLKDKSDVDLVAFIRSPRLRTIGSSLQRYRSELQDVISVLKTTVSRLRNVRIIRSDEYIVNFELYVESRWIQVDLLPTVDNIHGRNLDVVFDEMLRANSDDVGYYSACLVKLQRDFVKKQPENLKELIRLVKYWAYTNLPERLRKSYPLELITIYCWERAGSPWGFHKAQGLKAILLVLTNLSILRYYWREYYGRNLAEKSIRKLGHKRPIMLDPANPTNNVCSVYQEGNNMKEIAKAATVTLESNLLCDVTVHSNWWGYYY